MNSEGRSQTAPLNPVAVAETLREVARERARQHAKWGQQDHPDGTGPAFAEVAQDAREHCAQAFAQGDGTWRDILAEEVYEAFAEADPGALRAELIQVAAVAAAWIEAIDRAASDAKTTYRCPAHTDRPTPSCRACYPASNDASPPADLS